MKFSLAAVSAFVAYALAKPAFTNTNFNIQEGVDYTLKWKDATGPVTISLMNGPDEKSMKPFKTIASGVTGDSFTWTPEDLPSGTYAFKITDGDSTEDENYSVRFPYVGSVVATSSASSTLSTITKTSTSTQVSSTVESSTVESSSAASSTAASSTDASSTVTSAASSAASTTTSTRAATSTEAAPSNSPPNTNNAERFASPLALILGTVAALVFFN
ncbi:Ser-Thr-rich glycosyl-phosphatidyl-inositol-anchored membrane family-domain-containing protein [Pseudoneurospora amorphoporcata]|uniref:Ser-Thr-rich glycosyl-phosphatidyl-inositol-anchored membrane family-domain-containing protein n=1 Tax=Pseudoneurospora amorphoporcata TaxID=241081 RepID=A0AAN6NRD4_9PEZI|nr:Ser-Thr-rich glycosyl-phosphatidyl-inositol-anchored membrane family-domain-containing protein [Pseudoneurospora amorphoporcata]